MENNFSALKSKKRKRSLGFLKERIATGLINGVQSRPYPYHQKWHTLSEFFVPDYGVVETGTYLGETTTWLAMNFPNVVSIELDDKLFDFNAQQFSDDGRVEILHGSSGDRMNDAIDKVGKTGNFWLDGHYSGGITASAGNISPIIQELDAIFASGLSDYRIAIDDLRLFSFENANSGGYPNLKLIVEKLYTQGAELDFDCDMILARPAN